MYFEAVHDMFETMQIRNEICSEKQRLFCTARCTADSICSLPFVFNRLGTDRHHHSALKPFYKAQFCWTNAILRSSLYGIAGPELVELLQTIQLSKQ